MNLERTDGTRNLQACDELDLDTIGAFHVRWYQPDHTAGPFHSQRELAEYLQAKNLPRPPELLASLNTMEARTA